MAITSHIGPIGILLALALYFCGLLLANKVTGFGASAISLVVVTVITYLFGIIPTFGGVLSLISQYIMLKKINPQGSAFFTMILTTIIWVFLVFVFMEVLFVFFNVLI